MHLRLGFALIGLFFAGHVMASECAGVVWLDGDPQVSLARVKADVAKVNFIDNAKPGAPRCPSRDASCARRAFVVAGDRVLVTGEGEFLCASYKSPKGAETDGWLPDGALEIMATADTKLADWRGAWKRDVEGKISLKPAGAEIDISGEALWGSGDPERVRMGGVHSGELSGKARPVGNVLALGDGYDGRKAPDPEHAEDCFARLRLFGPYLLVEDNSGCGGMNVRFNGLYVRSGP